MFFSVNSPKKKNYFGKSLGLKLTLLKFNHQDIAQHHLPLNHSKKNSGIYIIYKIASSSVFKVKAKISFLVQKPGIHILTNNPQILNTRPNNCRHYLKHILDFLH